MKRKTPEERLEHRTGKAAVGEELQRRGYSTVRGEHLHCDKLAYRIENGRTVIMAGEYERSTKNVVRNIRRNLAQGADWILIGVPNETLKNAVVRKIESYFDDQTLAKIEVLVIERTS